MTRYWLLKEHSYQANGDPLRAFRLETTEGEEFNFERFFKEKISDEKFPISLFDCEFKDINEIKELITVEQIGELEYQVLDKLFFNQRNKMSGDQTQPRTYGASLII